MLHADTPLTYRPPRPSGARADPESLIARHLPLVRKIAWHVHGRVANAVEVEDLIQTGTVALIEAARAYEDRGHAFATYASVRVRGAMVDSLRRHAAGTRAAIKRRREFEAVRTKFQGERGRAPTDAEMADLTGLPFDAYRAAATQAEAIRHESIDDLYSDHSMWFADGGDMPEESLAKAQLSSALAAAIETLPRRDATVLQLYFVEELNLDEIGEVLGVGAARVCQIKKAALDKVRGLLGEDFG